MTARALTVRQPWADLIMAGVKDVENRTWPVPSTLPTWHRCEACDLRKPSRDLTGWLHDHDQDETPRAAPGVHRLVPDGPFPFRLGIHAATTVDPLNGPASWAWSEHDQTPWGRRWLDRKGALLGFVTVTGCHHADECYAVGAFRDVVRFRDGDPAGPDYCSRWAERDVYHWTLADPKPIGVPVPVRGRQGLWRLPGEVAA